MDKGDIQNNFLGALSLLAELAGSLKVAGEGKRRSPHLALIVLATNLRRAGPCCVASNALFIATCSCLYTEVTNRSSGYINWPLNTISYLFNQSIHQSLSNSLTSIKAYVIYIYIYIYIYRYIYKIIYIYRSLTF